jgi:hypothetical protein
MSSFTSELDDELPPSIPLKMTRNNYQDLDDELPPPVPLRRASYIPINKNENLYNFFTITQAFV